MPKEINGIPVYAFTIDELDDQYGFQMMSFVDEPAVEKAFIALARQPKTVRLSVNEEKRRVTGVAMRANFPIYRVDESGQEYYLYVSPEELEVMVEKFMSEKKTDRVNLLHDPDRRVDDVFLLESFLLNDAHKVTYPEFKDIENGSWMVTYKVNNDAVWQDIRSGRLRGFSVEMLGDMHGWSLRRQGNTRADLKRRLSLLINILYE